MVRGMNGRTDSPVVAVVVAVVVVVITPTYPYVSLLYFSPIINFFFFFSFVFLLLGRGGRFVQLEDTIKGFQEILSGKLDSLPEGNFITTLHHY